MIFSEWDYNVKHKLTGAANLVAFSCFDLHGACGDLFRQLRSVTFIFKFR